MKETSYLYKITNKITGKCYIGVSKNPTLRFKQHSIKSSPCTKLRNSINKYGIENFQLDILCKGTLEYISDLEGKAIEVYDSVANGYNILSGHHSKNLSLPDSVKEKISKATKGKKRDSYASDRPVYVLGFWFPSVRYCISVFNKKWEWCVSMHGTEQEFEKPLRKIRKDSKLKGPVYVAGFWWPDLAVASQHLKIKRSVLSKRVKNGFVEEVSTARKGINAGDRNCNYGRTGDKHHLSRQVFIEGKIYGSLREAQRITGYSRTTISRKIKNNSEDFYYV